MLPCSSLSDPFNLFSITQIFFFSTNITSVSSWFMSPISSPYVGCLWLYPLSFFSSNLPDAVSDLFITVITLFLKMSFIFCIPSGFPSIPSYPYACCSLFRSNSLSINNVRETGCFYNTDITLLSPAPPWKISCHPRQKKKGKDSNHIPFGSK